MSRILLTAASRVGRVRSNNEDMVLAYDKFIRSDAYQTEFMTENTDRFVVALADGMGGHNAGEVASEETLSNLKFFIEDLPRGLASGEFYEMVQEWMQSINQIINSRGMVDRSLLEMGTTLVCIFYYGGRFYWGNCGDSRLYRLRDGQLTQLSTDHSYNNGDDSKKHCNIITNCIGAGANDSYLDMFEFTDDVRSGDVYMLCSDGLNDMVPDSDIERLLSEDRTANQLCEAAIEKGGYDNVSTCILHID